MLLKLYLLVCKILMISFFTASWAFAQNLVPNPGFEQYHQESKGHSLFTNVVSWFNSCPNNHLPEFGTPDHLYAADAGNGYRRNEKYFTPRSGYCTAGLISYMQRLDNFREYISIKLEQPMMTGRTYQVSFWLSSGNHATFGSIGTNGFGVALSMYPPEQRRHEPLNMQPQFQLEKVFFKTGWQQFSFTLYADRPYAYLTMGNFLRDSQTAMRYFSYDIDPQSYFYVDDVSVVEGEGLPEDTQPTVSRPQTAAAAPQQPKPEQASVTPPAQPLEGRQVEVQSAFEAAPSGYVKLKLWDPRQVDGDVISLQFNGKWLLRNYTLRKRKKKIELFMERGAENKLIFFAHNLGEEPPNTAAIKLKSGKHVSTVSIRSDLNYCGAIELRR